MLIGLAKSMKKSSSQLQYHSY